MIINNKSIWEYNIDIKHTVESPPFIEIENARLFCGLSFEQFESLVGTNEFATEETTIGIYESKSDVLTYYRSQKMIEAIINQLNVTEIKNKN